MIARCTLALALAVLPTSRVHAADPARSPVTESPGERAARHFEAKEWDAAVEALVDAYALDPDPDYLYARAQAERFRGRCDDAIVYYRRFLASGPSPRQRADTDRNIAICREQQARVPPPRADARALEPAAQRPPPAAPRDVAGTVLVTLGAVGTLAGAAVWIAGSRLRARAPQAAHEADYVRTATRGRALTGAGIVITSVGATTLLAGVIRYAVVLRRARTRAG